MQVYAPVGETPYIWQRVALKLGVLACSQMTPEKPLRMVLSENLYCALMYAGVAELEVVGLIAFGVHVVDVEYQAELLARAEASRSRTRRRRDRVFQEP